MIPLARFLKQNPKLNHRTPRIAFTPAAVNCHQATLDAIERNAAADVAASPDPRFEAEEQRIKDRAEYMRNYRINHPAYQEKKRQHGRN